MRLTDALLGATIIAALLAGCSKGLDGDTTPPEAPVLLRSPPDTSARERGIDAVPEGDWIRIEWVLGREEDLAGYEIYRRDEDQMVDSLIVSLPIEDVTPVSADTVFWRDKTVNFYIRYIYRMKAFDRSGNRSSYSDTVDYKLLPKVDPEKPSGEIEERKPEFQFQWGEGASWISAYVIKLIDSEGNYVWISDKRDDVRGYGEPATITYNVDRKAISDSLASGTYWWRVDVIGSEPRCGSESEWMEFSVK